MRLPTSTFLVALIGTSVHALSSDQTTNSCGCESTCTPSVWDAVAEAYDDLGNFVTCGDRIAWVNTDNGVHEPLPIDEACSLVAAGSYVGGQVCVGCDPATCNSTPTPTTALQPADSSTTLDPPDETKLVWSDEFDVDGPPDSSKWDYDLGDGTDSPAGYGWGNSELQTYTSSDTNVAVQNGTLSITARNESLSGEYTSARLVTRGLQSFLYGRIQFRANLSRCKANGVWAALWMLPETNEYGIWPNSGEMDVMESVGHETDTFHGTVHTAAYNHHSNTQRGASIAASKGEWHVFEIDWGIDSIKFAVDSQVYYIFDRESGTDTSVWPFDQPFHLIMNIAVGGSWGGAGGGPDDDDAFRTGQTMEVDWVRVYADSLPVPTPAPRYCGCEHCTQEVWDATATAADDPANPYKCGDRITYLENVRGFTLENACSTIANTDYVTGDGRPCALCDPTLCAVVEVADGTSSSPTSNPTGSPTLKPTSDPTGRPSGAPSTSPIPASPSGSVTNIDIDVNGSLVSLSGERLEYNTLSQDEVNLALHKPSWQSSTGYGGVASRAVDGNTNGNWGDGSVTHTYQSTPAEWWVNLQVSAEIKSIIVYNRQDCCTNRLAGALVSLHHTNPDSGGMEMLHEREFGSSAAVHNIDFTDDTYVATHVRIRLPGGSVDLSLAEVQVMGFKVKQGNATLDNVADSISISGSTSMAYALPHSVPISRNTLLAFDVQVDHVSALTAICVDENTQMSDGNRCFGVQNMASWSNEIYMIPAYTHNQAKGGIVSQSSTCWGGNVNRAIDGNTNQYWDGHGITHTCNDGNPWFELDMKKSVTLDHVQILGRKDSCGGCHGTLRNSKVFVLDSNRNVVASSSTDNGDWTSEYNLNFGAIQGQYIRVERAGGNIQIVEILVWETVNVFPLKEMVSEAGTQSLQIPIGQFLYQDIPQSRNWDAVATQSSTCWGGPASRAFDGNIAYHYGSNTISHTCGGADQWFQLEFSKKTLFDHVQIHNRYESCCKNYNIESRVDVIDSAGSVVKSVVLTRQDLVHNLWFGGIEGKVIKMTKLKGGPLIISEFVVWEVPTQTVPGDINYISFIQEGDTAQTTFSNIEIYENDASTLRSGEVSTPLSLEVTIFGQAVTIPNVQRSIANSDPTDSRDTTDNILSLRDDGAKVRAYGNNFWKSFDLSESFEVTSSTVLKFDFSYSGQVPSQASLCLLGGDFVGDGRTDCFTAIGSGEETGGNIKPVYPLTSKDAASGAKTVSFLVGEFFSGPVRKLGFIVEGSGTYQIEWSDIEITTRPALEVRFDDTLISMKNNVLGYNGHELQVLARDYTNFGPSISDDGAKLTLEGRQFAAFKFPTPLSSNDLGDFLVTFDFTLVDGADRHYICAEENLTFGNADKVGANAANPRRCVVLGPTWASRQEVLHYHYALTQTKAGTSTKYGFRLSDMLDRIGVIKYLVFASDTETTRPKSIFANVKITTAPSACLSGAYSFDLEDCTVPTFLGAVQAQLDATAGCEGSDAMVEMMAVTNAIDSGEVDKYIEYVCTSAYAENSFDFADTLATQAPLARQLVKEHLDGGGIYDYERDEAGGPELEKDARRIDVVDSRLASSRLLAWPHHHALNNCRDSTAYCCYVTSRSEQSSFVPNSDVCYVDVKSSKYSAHVKNGYGLYTDGAQEVFCEGFAWDNEAASVSAALRGNLLFKTGFNNLYDQGMVEQIPGSSLCGCSDRMPAVTNVGCKSATAVDSLVSVTFDGLGFDATHTFSSIEYGDCDGLSLVDYAKSIGQSYEEAYNLKRKIVGEGNCDVATDAYLRRSRGLTLGRVPLPGAATSEVRIMSESIAGQYWKHRNDDDIGIANGGTQYKMISPGLTGEAGTVSFESQWAIGHYLRHSSDTLRLNKGDGGQRFKADATFKIVPALSGSGDEGYVSFQSVNLPTHFISHRGTRLYVDRFSPSNTYRGHASFKIVPATDVISRGKPTSQSSTSHGGESSRAVDGYIDRNYGDKSVTHTKMEADPWWLVDLEQSYSITSMCIHNREESYHAGLSDRIAGARIAFLAEDGTLISEMDLEYETYSTPWMCFGVPGGIVASKVKVWIPGQGKILSLAEVEIRGVVSSGNGSTLFN